MLYLKVATLSACNLSNCHEMRYHHVSMRKLVDFRDCSVDLLVTCPKHDADVNAILSEGTRGNTIYRSRKSRDLLIQLSMQVSDNVNVLQFLYTLYHVQARQR